MWTEMTKDLVTREAIEQMGYEYEETKWFYYIMSYLPYDEVLHLIELSDGIRRARRERARELRWEHDWRDDWGRPHHRHRHDHRRLHDGWDDERVRETEVIYDSHRPRFAR
ncbi:hypothetical protein DCS_04960 [Drechmeria coniospora]|uniref:DUF8035 domain-containing protein n=1 Tax=Drechmeria coniospora TaxID=98403 RepID=A0A151GLG1_DRECN|nr:hypothetical protein DCS_04960 [Drechmeria coniospora]KYK57947.1 hypothetical protein DCS_04960 [Drechmeria coniospora]